jgi:hypothetical protein
LSKVYNFPCLYFTPTAKFDLHLRLASELLFPTIDHEAVLFIKYEYTRVAVIYLTVLLIEKFTFADHLLLSTVAAPIPLVVFSRIERGVMANLI